MRRELKLLPDTPDEVVRNLVNKYHYDVISRVPSVGITLRKVTTNGGYPLTVVTTGVLGPVEKYELECTMDRIVDMFADPYGQWKDVRRRLHNFRQGRKTVAEQQFVLEYMDENFPEGG